MIGRKTKKPESEDKILDVNASMQGNMVFKDPVNLKINGTFEGTLTTKGNLTIGESAEVKADIIGENIVIAGQVNGDIIAERSLKLIPPARVIGDIKTPSLTIEEGSTLHGKTHMIFDESELNRLAPRNKKGVMTLEEVARYLEVEPSSVAEWATSGKLQRRKENNNWRFDRSIIDEWVKDEKIR